MHPAECYELGPVWISSGDMICSKRSSLYRYGTTGILLSATSSGVDLIRPHQGFSEIQGIVPADYRHHYGIRVPGLGSAVLIITGDQSLWQTPTFGMPSRSSAILKLFLSTLSPPVFHTNFQSQKPKLKKLEKR